MAQANRERLKRLALLGFISISIGLVGLIWAAGLSTDAPATPGYIRDTFEMDEDIWLTVTADAIRAEENGAGGTPSPTLQPTPRDHSGGGQGNGQGRAPTVAPPPGE